MKKNTNLLNDVRNFWNNESCGERYAKGNEDIDFYTSETENRYNLEPYIKSFAKFDSYTNKNVLEIGVGMGSDHSEIAKSSPKKLNGIDLTDRAIEHTSKRFKSLNLNTNLKVANAEKLPFENEIFDNVYSWGVIHHSPNTEICINEIYRVLKKNGTARIMIYNKYSVSGILLWVRYALFTLKPYISIKNIYAKYLESPGTKAYTTSEAKKMFKNFTKIEIKIQLSHGDLLLGDVGKRHKGLLLSIVKTIYPRFLLVFIDKIFPLGLFMLITVRK